VKNEKKCLAKPLSDIKKFEKHAVKQGVATPCLIEKIHLIFRCYAPHAQNLILNATNIWVRCTDLSEKQQTIVSSDSFMVTIVAKTYTAKSKTATPRNIWCSNFESTEKQRQRRDNICSNKM